MVFYQYGQLNTAALSTPGLYVQIVTPSGALLNGIPTNILAIAGTASWGPVNQAVIISGTQSYTQAFGTWTTRTYDMGTAVYAAVQEGANNMRCVRVTDGTDVAANTVILTNCVTIASKYTGSAGNNIVVAIANGAAANSYNLQVSMPGLSQEVFTNIGGTGAAFWGNLANAVNNGQNNIRGASQIVTATAGGGTTAPSVGTYTFANGTDGANANAATLIGADITSGRTGMYVFRGTGASVGHLADVTQYSNWSAIGAFGISEGIYMIQNGPAGESSALATAASNLTAANVDSYGLKVLVGDWLYVNDPLYAQRLVGPAPFYAGRLVNLSPQNSGLNKQFQSIVGSQRSGAPGTGQAQTYSQAELQFIVQNRLDVIASPSPGGQYFSPAVGHNCSSNPQIWGDNYTRMTNFLASTFAAGMGVYVGRTINVQLFLDIKTTINSFLSNLVQQGILARTISTNALPYYVVCDATNNPQNRIVLGFVQCDVDIQLQGINEKFIINVQDGVGVTVENQTLPQ